MIPDHDKRSVAQVCRTLFVIVHSRAPFRKVQIIKANLRHIKQLSELPSLLQYAVEVQWRPTPSRWSHYSGTNPPLKNCRPFTVLLECLRASHTLQVLALYRLVVNEQQQHVIFALPNLQRIVLGASYFTNTSKVLPTPRVKELALVGSLDPQKIEPLILHLGQSLTTLELNSRDSVRFYKSFPIDRVPLLRSLVHIDRDGGSILSVYPFPVLSDKNITKLHLTQSEPSLSWPPSVYAAFLPNLEDLTCDLRLAVKLIPSRPVRTYRRYPLSIPRRDTETDFISCLKRSTAQVTELRFVVSVYADGMMHVLSREFPHLERLWLWISDSATFYSRKSGRTNCDFYGSLWEPDAYHNEPSIETPAITTLKDLRIAFWKLGVQPPPVQFLERCRGLVQNKIKFLWPTLEVVEFLAHDSEDVPNKWWLKLVQNKNNEWEERSFDYMSPR
jgi:hypothetical protein